MALKTENERKFLVDLKAFNDWKKPMSIYDPPGGDDGVLEETLVQQGYLSLVPPVVRIRRAKEQRSGLSSHTVTVKLGGLQVRKEFEMGVTGADSAVLLTLCRFTVTKTRWLVQWNDARWEVDVFEKWFKGLCVAELENQRMPVKAKLPPWLGREVTKDKRYSNVMLAQFGIPDDARR